MSLQRMRARFFGLVIAAFVLVAQVPAQEAQRPLDLATFPRTALEITHHGSDRNVQRYSFQVWVADTPERAEQGLMFVNDLPETMGMVFPVQPPRVENMWMKNTYIELDMLFVDERWLDREHHAHGLGQIIDEQQALLRAFRCIGDPDLK